MIDPNATALLAAGIFPANNAVNGSGNPVFQGGNNVPTSVKEEIVRIDHQFSSKFSVFGHYLSRADCTELRNVDVERRQRPNRQQHLR